MKAKKERNGGAVVLACGFLFLGVLPFAVQSMSIEVVDVFGRPLEGIPVSFADDVPGTIGPHGGNRGSHYPGEYFLMTDKAGIVRTKLRFSARPVAHTFVKVNEDVYRVVDGKLQGYADEDIVAPRNGNYDSKVLRVKSETSLRVMLAPMDIDLSECERIEDEGANAECRIYALFTTAVRRKDASLYRQYDSPAMRNVLSGEHRHFLRRPRELELECLIFVEGILNGNASVCTQVENLGARKSDGPVKRDFKDQCEVIMSEWENDPKYCSPNWRERCRQMRLRQFNDTHRYLCENKDGPPEIRFLGTAATLYWDILCRQSM